MGPAWMLECIRLESGTCAFMRDGQRVTQSRRHFGLFLPAFAVVEASYEGVLWSWVGFSAPGPPPAPWLNAPLMFEVDASEYPDSPASLLNLVAQPRRHQALERISRPSAISRGAKVALDSSYRDDAQSIAAIALRLGVSHAHLTRSFKRDYGVSPLQYRQQLRVMDASERLFRGDAIASVAFDVGYHDLSGLYRGFREICEAPPGEIKKRQDSPALIRVFSRHGKEPADSDLRRRDHAR
jgi:AraC-like DNA-binding protein